MKEKQSSTDQKPKQVLKKTADRWMARNRSLVLRQTPVWAQSLVAIVISVGVTAVSAGIFFRIDEVITVQGQLEPIKGNVDVKTPSGGKIAEVFFKDGMIIRKGEPLVRFDTTQASTDKATYQRLIQLENSDLKDKLKIFEQRKKVLIQKVNTSERITTELKKLVSSGGFQRVQYLQQLDELYEQRSQLVNIDLEINRSKLESAKSIGQLTAKLNEAELQLRYRNVIAPASGIVFEPKAGVDGVIGAGEVLLTIIPQEGLKAKVYVANKDIGFVKTGQKAAVRVDAFPFTQYGELKGTVNQIGADALPPDETAGFYRYPVKLAINQPFLEHKGFKAPLRSGMAVTANLKLRDKRLISLISDLLVDQTDSIKGIRQQ